MEKIRIVLADDHEIVRNGIKQLFESEGYIEVVAEASNGKEAIVAVKNFKPDILVMDISMPEMTGIEAVDELSKLKTETKILILSMFDKDEYVLKAVEFGAYGYLLKDTGKESFIKALHTIMGGEKYFSSEISNIIVNQYLNTVGNPSSSKVKSELTKRENDILSLVVKGYNNRKIAEEFGISVRTIETHRLNIMKKLKVNNAAELVRVAIENKLVAL